jgi:hypothetical protein
LAAHAQDLDEAEAGDGVARIRGQRPAQRLLRLRQAVGVEHDGRQAALGGAVAGEVLHQGREFRDRFGGPSRGIQRVGDEGPQLGAAVAQRERAAEAGERLRVAAAVEVPRAGAPRPGGAGAICFSWSSGHSFPQVLRWPATPARCP